MVSGLPKPRPHYMVKALYEEPVRAWAFVLYCSCAIEEATGRIVGVSVVTAGKDDRPLSEEAWLARLVTDAAQLITYHLRLGVLPEDLSLKLHGATAGGGEVGSGPGQVKFPIQRPGLCLVGLTSPLSAIVTACVVAHTDWRSKTVQLAREGIVGHA